MAKVLILLRMEMRGIEERGNLAFVQDTECSPPCDIMDKVMGCVTLRWSTDYDTDHKISKSSSFSEEDSLRGGQWFAVAPSCSVKAQFTCKI